MKKKSNVCDKKSEKIDKKIDEKIANILENDIVANTHVLDDYNAEKKDITKYEWLYDSIINDPKYNDLTYEERYNLFIDCSSIVEDSLIKVDDEVVYEYNDKIFMYFLSLENDKMFLYADFKYDEDTIMYYCEEKYEYVKLNKPKKIVFTLEIFDLYDVDKYVKMFMHMFGINETRGGSYTDVKLPEFLIKAIEFEKPITCMDFYKKKNK